MAYCGTTKEIKDSFLLKKQQAGFQWTRCGNSLGFEKEAGISGADWG
jgi:hypothetical protein